ncbi:MAG: SRPBCC domain-containing protein [Acidimicrobiia bacterium]
MTDHRHPLGTFLQDGDRVGLRFERHLRHPLERVWRALTESASLRQWLPADIVGPREAGAAVQLPFWPDVVQRYGIEDPVVPGRIIVWEPPTRFSWQWGADELHFELLAIGDDAEHTRLVFTTWIGDASPGLANIAGGYHTCFDLLVDSLDHGSAAPLVDQDPERYAGDYEPLAAALG